MADEEKNEETTEEPEVEAEAPAAEEPVAEQEAVAEQEPAEQEPAEQGSDPEASDPGSEPEAEVAPEAEPVAPAKTKSLRHVPRSLRRTRSKTKREQPAKRKPITRTAKPATEPARRQERRGVVVSDKGDKTIVVKVDVIKSHPKYKKVIRRAVKFHAHDEGNSAAIGDTVRIVETRPLSKTKNWRLAEIVERAR